MIIPAVTVLILNDIINIHLCYAEEPGTPSHHIITVYNVVPTPSSLCGLH